MVSVGKRRICLRTVAHYKILGTKANVKSLVFNPSISGNWIMQKNTLRIVETLLYLAVRLDFNHLHETALPFRTRRKEPKNVTNRQNSDVRNRFLGKKDSPSSSIMSKKYFLKALKIPHLLFVVEKTLALNQLLPSKNVTPSVSQKKIRGMLCYLLLARVPVRNSKITTTCFKIRCCAVEFQTQLWYGYRCMKKKLERRNV